MKWKVIGEKSIGTSHSQSNKYCEDSICYEIIQNLEEEILICCISDGAGSAKYAEEASSHVTNRCVEILKSQVQANSKIDVTSVLKLAELLYDELEQKSIELKVAINEFSCTFLGCVLYENKSIFFQIGDGIIIREDGCGNYVNLWLPHNGEYSNVTTFLVDDLNFSNLRLVELDYATNEVALTTDGLQLLILNNETNNIHQPFFFELFKWLRIARDKEQIDILGTKLEQYLSSDLINSRTDDDKALILATRIKND